MSFCCGASMIGAKGNLRHFQTRILNVPILFCPVCRRLEVHYLVENEYEIVAEYARGDGAEEVDFQEYIQELDWDRLFENCVNHEEEDPLEVLRSQIDMALDLLIIAKQLGDEEWIGQLKQRLGVMSGRKARLLQSRQPGGRR